MYHYNAMLVKVVDGDTLDLMIDLGLAIFKRARIRLYGIDTPEVYGVKHDSDEYRKGKLASDFVKQILPPGTKVTIKTMKDKKGKFGRYVAEVYYTDNNEIEHNLAHEIVKAGMGRIAIY